MIQNPSLQNRTSTVERNDCFITKIYRFSNSVRSPFFEFLFIFFTFLDIIYLWFRIVFLLPYKFRPYHGLERSLSLVEVLYFTKHIYFFLYSYLMHPYIAPLKKKH